MYNHSHLAKVCFYWYCGGTVIPMLMPLQQQSPPIRYVSIPVIDSGHENMGPTGLKILAKVTQKERSLHTPLCTFSLHMRMWHDNGFKYGYLPVSSDPRTDTNILYLAYWPILEIHTSVIIRIQLLVVYLDQSNSLLICVWVKSITKNSETLIPLKWIKLNKQWWRSINIHQIICTLIENDYLHIVLEKQILRKRRSHLLLHFIWFTPYLFKIASSQTISLSKIMRKPNPWNQTGCKEMPPKISATVIVASCQPHIRNQHTKGPQQLKNQEKLN